MNAPFLVGVTGAIGSGKSLLCRLLAEAHDVPLIDADRLGHDAIAAGGAARDAVVARFGARVLGADGEIDRSRLGRIAFADPEALRALNQLVHPVILHEIGHRVASLKEDRRAGIILLDAALLPAWRESCRPDAIVLVRAAEGTRRSRLIAQGLAAADARRRMEAQEALFQGEIGADWVVDNDGTIADLEHAAQALWQDLGTRFGTTGEMRTT